MANLIPEQKILAKQLEMEKHDRIESKFKKTKAKAPTNDYDWQRVTPLIYPASKRLEHFKEMKEEKIKRNKSTKMIDDSPTRRKKNVQMSSSEILGET